jgi:hypothetical protein
MKLISLKKRVTVPNRDLAFSKMPMRHMVLGT